MFLLPQTLVVVLSPNLAHALSPTFAATLSLFLALPLSYENLLRNAVKMTKRCTSPTIPQLKLPLGICTEVADQKGKGCGTLCDHSNTDGGEHD